MSQVKDCPVIGLDSGFPDKVFVVAYPTNDTYGCFCFKGLHGLACYSTEVGARGYAEVLLLHGGAVAPVVKEVSFDEAREIAKSRPERITCVMLLDDMENPVIHYVR